MQRTLFNTMVDLDTIGSHVIPLEEVAQSQGNDIQAILLADFEYDMNPSFHQVITRLSLYSARIGYLSRLSGQPIQESGWLLHVTNLTQVYEIMRSLEASVVLMKSDLELKNYIIPPRVYSAYKDNRVKSPHQIPHDNHGNAARAPLYFAERRFNV